MKLSIKTGNALARLLRRIADWCEYKAYALERCPKCGRNIFYDPIGCRQPQSPDQ